MHFNTKSYLKSIRNHTVNHALNMKDIVSTILIICLIKF
jgi:hypothetical protein